MNKQCKVQGLTKSLHRSYSIESMDSDTDCIIVNLNLEDIINNYNTWNHLTVSEQMSAMSLKSYLHLLKKDV